jgi:cytoskeletal protein RodZ
MFNSPYIIDNNSTKVGSYEVGFLYIIVLISLLIVFVIVLVYYPEFNLINFMKKTPQKNKNIDKNDTNSVEATINDDNDVIRDDDNDDDTTTDGDDDITTDDDDNDTTTDDETDNTETNNSENSQEIILNDYDDRSVNAIPPELRWAPLGSY